MPIGRLPDMDAFLDTPALVAAWDRKDWPTFWATAHSHDPDDLIPAMTSMLLRELRWQKKDVTDWVDLQTLVTLDAFSEDIGDE